MWWYRLCGDSRARLSGSAVRLAICCFILFAPPRLPASDCLALAEAAHHVGETKCVTGRVLRVKVGAQGVHFLDFCEDQMACPFTVVVFPHDLKDVGDVRRLAGRVVEVRGPVKLYDGRAEIILNRISQITGGSTPIPPLPKNYDVENRGHYSAGHVRPTKKPAKTKSTPNPTATYGKEPEDEDAQQ
jgi:DNA/RNA endonuclease YhcR with UshA esterase domain